VWRASATIWGLYHHRAGAEVEVRSSALLFCLEVFALPKEKERWFGVLN
jgi:hypothetical protein